MLTILLAAGLSFAQSVGDFRILNQEAQLRRFQGSDEISATVKKGTKVEIVAEGKGTVRVRAGRDFGWVETKLLDEVPKKEK